MPLHLSEIKGDNYFLIADNSANKTLENISFMLEIKKETEEFLKETREDLKDCIGYREAKKIGSYTELRKAVKEEIEHRRPYNEFAERFWEETIRAAPNESNINPEEEIARDAIYHTLRRTGFVEVYNIIKNSNFDELDITNSVLAGEDFYQLVPLPKDTIELLTKAMVSSLEREKFMDSLKRQGLSREQLKQIDNALYKSDSFDRAYEEIRKIVDIPKERLYTFFLDTRNFNKGFEQFAKNLGHELGSEQIELLRNSLKKLHKGLGKNQPFNLERALRELYSGRQDIEYVLSLDYRRNYSYYLADLINKLDLKRPNVERVHTRIGGLIGLINNGYKMGRISIPGKIIKRLGKLTGLDPWQYISKFDLAGSYMKLLYPEVEIPDDVLGELYGELLSRGSMYVEGRKIRWRYVLRKPKEHVLNFIEKVGKLNREPACHIRKRDAKVLAEVWGGIPTKTQYEMRVMRIPKQIGNIYQSIDPEALSEEFAKSALMVYLENRGRKQSYGRICLISSGDEYIVRSLASRVGLSISKGSFDGNQKVCYVKNPWVVGL